MKVKSLIVLSESVTIVIIKCTHITGACFSKLRWWFHSVIFIINIHFPPLLVTPFAGLNRRSSSRTVYFISSSTARTGSSECIFLVSQNYGSRRVLIRDCREYKGEQSTPLSQLPPLCAVWRCLSGGIDPTSCLAEPLEFLVLTSLMSAHIAVNWLWRLSTGIPLTRFLHFLRSRCCGWSAAEGLLL